MRGLEGKSSVRVTAPARLHLGFLDPDGALGRRFGSLGLAVDAPVTEVIIERARSLGAHGPHASRVLKILERCCSAMGLEPAFSAEVVRAIPAHAGLGSGTQLGLAVGAGLAALTGRGRSVQELAEIADRGARSAIGMAAFEKGGFILDGGRGPYDTVPPLLTRCPFPEDWRVLLVMDARVEGVHGKDESEAFAALPPMPATTAAHLCHLVLMRLLPGIVEADIDAFGSAVTEVQAIVGKHFAAAQGGSPWSSAAVGRLVSRLAAAGAVGVGQSSWGPTGFAFVPTLDAARRLYQSCTEAARAEGLELHIARGRNTGARIEPLEAAAQKAVLRRTE